MRYAVVLLLALSGCGDTVATAPVAIKFSNSNAMPGVGIGYNAPDGVATMTVDGVMLDSKAGGAELLVLLDAPTTGQVNIGEHHLDIEYSVGAAGWASNSGSVTFTSLAPYDVTFNNVEMIGATAAGTGAFFLNGSAVFK